MSALMAAGQTTPERSQIQQHRSINAHNKEKGHKLRNQKSQDNVCKRFAQPSTLAITLSRLCIKAVLVGPILALQHWNFKDFMQKQRCSLGIQHLRGSLGHVRNHGGSSQQSERHPSNHLLARAENHQHTEHKLHVATYNRIAQLYLVPNTSWRLKTKATLVAHILTIRSLNLLDTCASTHVVSLPSEFLLTCSQSCRQDNPLKCGPNTIARTANHKHPKQISLDAACERFSTLTKVPNTSWTIDNVVAQIFTLQNWNAH